MPERTVKSAGVSDPPAARGASPCPRCESTDASLPAPGILRCARCGALTPHDPPDALALLGPVPAELAHAAPGGVLRDRYRLVGELGRGRHGVCLLARHEFLNHPCVVKFLLPRAADSPTTAARGLRDEARAAFLISHPNVVRVLDCDQAGGMWFLASEFVEGFDLQRPLRAGLRLDWRQALAVACDAAAGLAAIHERGLLHRDIKPSNFLLGSDGRTRVADFGVAALCAPDSDPPRAAPGGSAGAPAYLAPEALVPGAPIGPASDIFALGATLFHLLTGSVPHASGGVVRGLIDRQSRAPAWPAETLDEVPGWFVAAVTRCLDAEPARRFESAAALLDHLRNASRLPVPRPGASGTESLQPRGVVVLPFENRGAEAEDDWLGFALADMVAAELRHLPGVFVADRDQLLRFRSELDGAAPDPRRREAEAARLVGAATIVGGTFRRSGPSIELTATLRGVDDAPAVEIGRAQAPVNELARLRTVVAGWVGSRLGGSAGEATEALPSAPAGVSLAAQQLYVQALQTYLSGDYANAARLASEAVALDPAFVEPLGFIGACCARLGRYDEAAHWHGRLEAAGRERGDRRLLTEAWANLGLMYYFKGDYAEAERYCTDAAALAAQAGLLRELADIHNNLGFVLLRLDRLADAEAAFRRAATTYEAFGALVSLVAPYNGLGNVLMAQQRLDEAAEFHRKALALAQQTGDLAKVGVSHLNLGHVASAARDFATAKAEFALAYGALERTGFWNGIARWYEYVAEMNIAQGDYQQATLCADRRIESARSHGNLSMERDAWMQKARALDLAGLHEQAESCRRLAVATSTERSEPP